MTKFKIGDRVSFQDDFQGSISLYEGTIVDIRMGSGWENNCTSYWILLNVGSKTCCISENRLTFSDEYWEFIEKIKDRMPLCTMVL